MYYFLLYEQMLSIVSLGCSIVFFMLICYDSRKLNSILQYLGLFLIGCLFGYCMANDYEPICYINIRILFVPVYVNIVVSCFIRLIKFINREESNEA